MPTSLIDLSVNCANVNLGYTDPVTLAPACVMRTGSRTNTAGSFNGGGTGNKAILGLRGFDRKPLSDLVSLEYTFRNLLGPGGPFFSPPGAATVTTPYVNFLVDFNPFGGGDVRVLSLVDDSLSAAITAAIGSYANPGGLNTLTYSWDETKDVLIVLAPPNAVPGGVVPDVTVSTSWTGNAYKWSALKAANPTARFVDAFPATTASPTGDGGMPVGAVVPAVALVSGDSGNLVKSGKYVLDFKVNGVPVL